MPLYLSQFVPGPFTGRRPGGSPIAAGSDEWPYNLVSLEPEDSGSHVLLWSDGPVRHPRATKIADGVSERVAVSSSHKLSKMLPLMRTDRPPVAEAIVSGIAHLLRPCKVNRRLEVWLGPGGPGKNLLWSCPAVVGHSSKDVQDSFNRAAGNLAGSTSSDSQFTWSESQGTALTTSGTTCGFAVTSTVGFNVGLVSLAMDTADHYAQADLVTLSRPGGGDLIPGVGVRVTNGTGSSDSGYGFEAGFAGGDLRRIYNFVSDATLASTTTVTTAGLLYFQASGSSLLAKINGVTVLGPTTNTTYPGTGSQKKVIITAYGAHISGTQTIALDDFRAADLVAAGGTPLIPRRPNQAVHRANFR